MTDTVIDSQSDSPVNECGFFGYIHILDISQNSYIFINLTYPTHCQGSIHRSVLHQEFSRGIHSQ